MALHQQLVGAAVPATQAERIDLLRALEDLKAALTAVQATVALAFDAAERQEEASAGVPAAKRGQGVPAQVGPALRESPARTRSFLGAARVWHTEMPHTLAALRAGRLSAWRATLVVKETAHLPLEARMVVDQEICADPATTQGVGTAELAARVKKRAAELDPAAAAERARRAEGERAVWIRPAPDTMSYVTALLPMATGVGVYAALRRAADGARAQGDDRSRGQLMADTLVELVTGQATAQDVPVTVNLVVSDATLLGAGHEPAVVTADAGPGGGVVPAQVARNLVAHALDANAVWLRRLYVDPGGDLVAASSSSRFFADGLAAMLRARDQGICRSPFCDAPVRHLDHVDPAGNDGATSLVNGQGYCVACNQAKNAGVLRQSVVTGASRHTVRTTTATGHEYTSTAPEPPRPAASVGSAESGVSGASVVATGSATRVVTASSVVAPESTTSGVAAARRTGDGVGVDSARTARGRPVGGARRIERRAQRHGPRAGRSGRPASPVERAFATPLRARRREPATGERSGV